MSEPSYALDRELFETAPASPRAWTLFTWNVPALARELDRSAGPSKRIDDAYDGSSCIEELAQGTGLSSKTFVHGPGIDNPIYMDDGSAKSYYCSNSIGSITALADSTGAVVERYQYTPFGETSIFNVSGASNAANADITASTNDAGGFDNPFRFTARRKDFEEESELYDYRTRYYRPKTGRFISHDSIGDWGDASNVGNGLTYAGNNPVNFVDPWGMDGEGKPGAPQEGSGGGSGDPSDMKGGHNENARESTREKHQKANKRRMREQKGTKKTKAGRFEPGSSRKKLNKPKVPCEGPNGKKALKEIERSIEGIEGLVRDARKAKGAPKALDALREQLENLKGQAAQAAKKGKSFTLPVWLRKLLGKGARCLGPVGNVLDLWEWMAGPKKCNCGEWGPFLWLDADQCGCRDHEKRSLRPRERVASSGRGIEPPTKPRSG